MEEDLIRVAAIVSARLGRELSSSETRKVAAAYLDMAPQVRRGDLDRTATRIIESHFAGDMDDFTRQFQKNIIAEPNNANYYTGANLTKDFGSNVRKQGDVRDGVLIADDLLSANAQIILQKMLTSVENNVLAPNYIYNYIVLDSMYSDFPVYHLPYVGFDQIPPYTYFLSTNLQSVYSWQLTANLKNSNNSVVALKYPIAQPIRIDILPFFLPPYYNFKQYGWYEVALPANKRIKITIAEIVETYTANNDQAFTMPAVIARDEAKYNGLYSSRLRKVTPMNSGALTFRFAQDSITSLTLAFDDFNGPMLMPPPIMPGQIIFNNGGQAQVKIKETATPQGDLLDDNELVIFLNVVASQPIADAAYVTTLSRQNGWLVVGLPAEGYSFRIPFDISGMAGSFTAFDVYVPARRITIPIVITQVRPGNFYF